MCPKTNPPAGIFPGRYPEISGKLNFETTGKNIINVSLFSQCKKPIRNKAGVYGVLAQKTYRKLLWIDHT